MVVDAEQAPRDVLKAAAHDLRALGEDENEEEREEDQEDEAVEWNEPGGEEKIDEENE